MKRIFVIVLLFVFAFGCATNKSKLKYKESMGFSYSFDSDSAECRIYSFNPINYSKHYKDYYKNDSREVIIPEKLGGKTVVQIGSNRTYNNMGPFGNKGLTSVIIPDSVNYIGACAFRDNKLINIVIPDNVNHIGDGAFHNNKLTSIDIPKGVKILRGFSNNQLTIININDGVTEIGDNAFTDNKLTSVIIPSSVRRIGENAFKGNQLTNIIIPESVTFIGANAFSGNRITSVTIPASVKLIGKNAFGYAAITLAPRDLLAEITKLRNDIKNTRNPNLGTYENETNLNTLAIIWEAYCKENSKPIPKALEGTWTASGIGAYAGGTRTETYIIPRNSKDPNVKAAWETGARTVTTPGFAGRVDTYTITSNSVRYTTSHPLTLPDIRRILQPFNRPTNVFFFNGETIELVCGTILELQNNNTVLKGFTKK